jgi:hypothetical protein
MDGGFLSESEESEVNALCMIRTIKIGDFIIM